MLAFVLSSRPASSDVMQLQKNGRKQKTHFKAMNYCRCSALWKTKQGDTTSTGQLAADELIGQVESRLWYGVEADTGSYAASMIEADSESGD